jgi:hypothetical protein
MNVQITTRPNVILCKSVDDLMTAILGPAQQDEHMKAWRWQKYCRDVYGFTPKKASAN